MFKIYKLSNDNGSYYGKTKLAENITRTLIQYYSKGNRIDLTYYPIIKDPYNFEIVYSSDDRNKVLERLKDLFNTDPNCVNIRENEIEKKNKEKIRKNSQIVKEKKRKFVNEEARKEKQKEYNKNHYEKNRNRVKEYYETHKEQIRLRQKERYEKRKEELAKLKTIRENIKKLCSIDNIENGSEQIA